MLSEDSRRLDEDGCNAKQNSGRDVRAKAQSRCRCVEGNTDRGAGYGSLEVEALHQILDRKLDVLFKSRVVGTMVPISSCLHHRCWTHAKLVSCRWIYLGEVENCAHVRV